MSKKVFETEWFSIDELKQDSGKAKPYYRLSCADSAVILALTPRGRILLIRQFRPAIGESALEFPAGHIDDGESPEAAIARELFEETGYECGEIVPLGTFRVFNSRINNKIHAFFGKDIRLRDASKAERGIEVLTVTQKEFLRLVDRGDFDVVTCIGLYGLAKLRKLL